METGAGCEPSSALLRVISPMTASISSREIIPAAAALARAASAPPSIAIPGASDPVENQIDATPERFQQ